MKKVLSIFLVLCIVAGGTVMPSASYDSAEQIYQFDSYTAEKGQGTPPSGWTVRDGGVESGDMIYSLATERGRSAAMTIYSATRQVQYTADISLKDGEPYAFEAGVLRKDLKSVLKLGLRDSSSAVNGVFLNKDGSVSVFGKVVPGFTYTANEWLDFRLTVLPADGSFGFQVYQGERYGELYSTGAPENGVTNIRIFYDAGTYEGGSTTVIDDVRLYNCDSFVKPKEDSESDETDLSLLYDFNSFEASEPYNTAPSGFSASSVLGGEASGYRSVSKNGDTAVQLFAKTDNMIQLVKLMNAYTNWSKTSTIAADVRVSGESFTACTVKIRKSSTEFIDIVKFCNDGKMYIGTDEEGIQYDSDEEWYNICLQFDTQDMKVKSGTVKCTVKKGNTTVADGVAVTDEKMSGLELSSNDTRLVFQIDKDRNENECKFDIDNVKFDVKAEETVDTEEQQKPMQLLGSNPTAERNWIPLNTNVRLIFNKALSDEMEGIWSLNGNVFAESRISVSDENPRVLTVDLSGETELGQSCVLTWDGLADTFGNTVSGSTNFKISEKKVLLSDLNALKSSGNAYTLTVGGVTYDGTSRPLTVIASVFDSSCGAMRQKIPYEMTINPAYTESEKTMTIADTEAIAEVYYWDSLKDMNILGDSAALQNETTALKGYNGDSEMKATVDYESGRLTVMGKAEGEALSVLVLKPNRSSAELGTGSAEEQCGAAEYIRQVKCVDGGFSISYDLENVYGARTIRVNSQDGRGAIEYTNAVNYLTETEIAELIESYNDPESDFADLISQSFASIGLDKTLYNSLSPGGKTQVQTAMKEGRPYTTISRLQGTFNDAALACVLTEALDFETTAIKYADIWDMRTAAAYPTYIKYKSKISDTVFSRMETGVFKTIDEVEKALNDAVILSAIDEAVLYTEGKAVISDNAGYLNWNLTKFNSLTSTKPVYTAITGNAYESVEKLKDAFDKAVDEQALAESSNDGGGIGGGGGAGGGGISIGINLGKVTSDSEKETQTDIQPDTQPEKASAFDDLESVSWAKVAVEELAKLGILNGKSDRTFEPMAEVTREEFAKMVVSAFVGDDISVRTDAGFTDAVSGEWYIPYLAKAQAAEIVFGYDGMFGVGQSITRQDLAVMCMRAAKYAKIDMESGRAQLFDDDSEIEGYAAEAVSALRAIGVLSGDDNNRFRPMDSATRAEAAKVIYEIMQRRK